MTNKFSTTVVTNIGQTNQNCQRGQNYCVSDKYLTTFSGLMWVIIEYINSLQQNVVHITTIYS